MDNKQKTTELLTLFLDSIRNYEREAGHSIANDERDSLEFVNTYLDDDYSEDHPKWLSPTIYVPIGDDYIQCDITDLYRGDEIKAYFSNGKNIKVIEYGIVDIVCVTENTVVMRHTHIENSMRFLTHNYVIYKKK